MPKCSNQVFHTSIYMIKKNDILMFRVFFQTIDISSSQACTGSASTLPMETSLQLSPNSVSPQSCNVIDSFLYHCLLLALRYPFSKNTQTSVFRFSFIARSLWLCMGDAFTFSYLILDMFKSKKSRKLKALFCVTESCKLPTKRKIHFKVNLKTLARKNGIYFIKILLTGVSCWWNELLSACLYKPVWM